MKKHYLFYAFILLLLATACRKNNIVIDKNKPNNGTDNGGKPPILVSPPKLSNLRINGAACAFDSLANAYYYPVPLGASLNGYTISFDTTVVKSITLDNLKQKNGDLVNYELKTNQQLVVKTADKSGASLTYSLTITGLPIVMLRTSSAIGDDRVAASLTLVNSDYVAEKTDLQISTNITINLRGATSRYYPKSSYAVHVTNESGSDRDLSFLGLRDDNSWILDAMYIDQSRMRNRLCTDIWNSFNNVPHIASEPKALNGTRGYMTEVFLNNQYRGVYCLTEKLDRKQLQVKKQYGNVYKANLWTDQTALYRVIPFDNNSDTWGGWELEYPELGDTPAPNWGYLYDIVNFLGTSTDSEFDAEVKNKVDINNIVDYFIFVNMMQAPDNENKNTFFSFYDYRNAPKFFYSVWDLDGSMGRNAAGNYLANTLVKTSNNNLMDRLMTLNTGNFKALVKARWNALKDNQFSKATVGSRIEAYRRQLVNTNAFARERGVWTNITQDLNTEADYMTNWYFAQYNLFDDYVDGL